MHMQYCIKLDIGIVMSAFLVRWQMEEEFKNAIINLSDFPFCKKTGNSWDNGKELGFSGCYLLLWGMYLCQFYHRLITNRYCTKIIPWRPSKLTAYSHSIQGVNTV